MVGFPLWVRSFGGFLRVVKVLLPEVEFVEAPAVRRRGGASLKLESLALWITGLYIHCVLLVHNHNEAEHELTYQLHPT